MTKKIALIGSAPSSVTLAPFTDDSWTIWGCSPGAYPHIKRCDRFFELHRREPGKPWFAREYVEFLANLKCPVTVVEPWPELPTYSLLPKDELIRKFGPYVFKSSLSWMMAMAVMEGATEIGLWGVDMAAREEWQFQRTALQCLMWRIQEEPYNCSVTLPPESDLWMPGGLYGLQEVDPHHIKVLKRRDELEDRRKVARHNLGIAQREADFLDGAYDDNEYHLMTWVTDPIAREMAIKGPTKALPAPVAPAEPTAFAPGHGEPEPNWEEWEPKPQPMPAPTKRPRRSRKNGNGQLQAAE
jgi:hypothetical protein